MKNEARIFLTAVMFYTRIPVPASVGYSHENLNKATRYLPLIGIIVGALGAASFFAFSFFLPVHVSVFISVLFTIILTGAFHEDAIADFCDGFGGGYTKEKILEIMKDSRIGTYGAIALVLTLIGKILIVSEISLANIPFVIISAHALSRLSPVVLIFTSQYVRLDADAKAKPVAGNISPVTLIVAIFFGVAPLLLLHLWFLPIILVSFTAIFLLFRNYVHKKIGGYTGDVLGALQQISEISFYLLFLLFEKVPWNCF